jgi:hypothetical protein
MNTLIRKLRSGWRLPYREKLWFILFYPYSGLIRLAILTLPYRILSRRYGYPYANTQLSLPVSASDRQLAWRIGKIAELTAQYTPWESKCLVQALMVRTLLRFYRIPHLMHLGAVLTKNPNEPMKAHAWVKVGPWVVSGRDGHQAFAILATFVSIRLSETDSPNQTAHLTAYH